MDHPSNLSASCGCREPPRLAIYVACLSSPGVSRVALRGGRLESVGEDGTAYFRLSLQGEFKQFSCRLQGSQQGDTTGTGVYTNLHLEFSLD